jgi:hypothetical protein
MFRRSARCGTGTRSGSSSPGGDVRSRSRPGTRTMFSGFYLALLLGPLLPDHPRRLVRVAEKSEHARAGARVWLWANTAEHGVPLIWGSRSRTSSTACRSTRDGDYAARSGICSAPTRSRRHRVRAPVRLPRAIVPHAAHDGRPLRAARPCGARCPLPARRRSRRFSIWTVAVAVDRTTRTSSRRCSAAAAIAALVLRRRLVYAAGAAGLRDDRGRDRRRRRDPLHEPLPARDGLRPTLAQQPHGGRRPRPPTTRWR